jgi:CRP/FNR family cyclic AMP-dependent transcriptional regulator
MLALRYKWTPFLSYGQKLEMKKNTVVYRQGENGRGFYYLDQGGVKIILLADNGHERIIDYVPIGTLLGEHGAHRGSYLTTAVTTSPSTLYYFSNEALANVCKDHPYAAMLFTNSHIYKVRLLAEIISLLDSPFELQMAHYLLKLIQIHENDHVPIDQTSLASYIGTSRITVNKIIQKWRQQGLIHFCNGVIRVMDVEKLRDILADHEKIAEPHDV